MSRRRDRGGHGATALVLTAFAASLTTYGCGGRTRGADAGRSRETTTTVATTTAPAATPTPAEPAALDPSGAAIDPSGEPAPPAPPQVHIEAHHAEHRGAIETSGAAEHACALVSQRRTVFATAAAPAAIGLRVGHALAAYVPSAAGTDLVVLTFAPNGRTPRILGRFPVSPALRPTQLVPPAIARIDDAHVAVASVDAMRRITYREVDLTTGEASAELLVADGTADTRYPPTIATFGDVRLVAFTRFGNPMRVEVVVVVAGPRAVARHDVTPDSAGAASPGFVHGTTPPLLVLVDPREAFSLSHAITFDAQGNPGDDDSLQPIVGLEAPPRVVAALGPHDLELAFLAHGATNEMGTFLLASHAPSITPRALVPASDHARLWVDAMGTGYGVVTASLGPRGGVALADREVVVRLVDAAGIGPELRIAPARGSAVYPALSRDDDGHLAVVFGTADGIDVAEIGCRGVAP